MSAARDLTHSLLNALPQTQCTRCGYPDCEGYAQAMAQGEANINQCPPGGQEGVVRLSHLTVEGELDDISGSGQTEAAHGLCFNVPKDRQKHIEVKGAGHYGIFSGRRWRESVHPEVRDFILKHPNGAVPAGSRAAKAASSKATTKTTVKTAARKATPGTASARQATASRKTGKAARSARRA